MSDQQSKNFALGAWVYENTIRTQNTSFVNWTIKGNVNEFCAWLQTIADEKGEFRLTMSERRERQPRKPTHNLYQDTYKPRERNDAPSSTHYEPQNYSAHTNHTNTPQPHHHASADNLPF